MRQPFNVLFPCIVLIVLFTGCTIEKRLYTKGWSVQYRHGHTSAPDDQQQANRNTSVPAERTVTVANAALPDTHSLSDNPEKGSILPVQESDALPAAALCVSQRDADDTLSEERQQAEVRQDAGRTNASDRQNTVSIIAGVVLVLSVIGIVVAFASLLSGAGTATALAALGAGFLLIILALIAFIVLVAGYSSGDRYTSGQYSSRKPKKAKTPEQAAHLKRKGAIAIGVFFAAVAAIITAIHVS